jgi:hypothetical protein
MKPSIFPKILCAVLFLIVIGWAPQTVFAQHGGHGGGAGFHGGGGGWHGGGGGWHGGGGGWHGGGGGWHGGAYRGGWGGGGYWGYPGWGYGWGLSIGFNWGPFWGGYAYPYGFGWAPRYYPYYYPYGYTYPYYVPAEDPPGYAYSYSSYGADSNGYGYSSRPTSSTYADNSATQPSSPPASDGALNVTIHEASYTRPAHSLTTRAATPSSYRPANSATRQLPALRPAVQNVIRALRAMPPDVRQRQIDPGRYNNFSPQELELVKYASGLPSQWEPEEASLRVK